MTKNVFDKKMNVLLLCGILGCILMGGSDWLMIYGDTAFQGNLAWLTVGAAHIAPWRNALALLMAFPAVVLYALALLEIARFMPVEKHRRTYRTLTTLGMTPWLCLHLFYIMILYLFSWLTLHASSQEALQTCEAVFSQFGWVVALSELLMLLPFFYLFVETVSGKTIFPRWMAVNNPLLLYVVLKLFTMLLPDVPFRLAFTNGLMSESMVIWFLIFWIYSAAAEKQNKCNAGL